MVFRARHFRTISSNILLTSIKKDFYLVGKRNVPKTGFKSSHPLIYSFGNFGHDEKKGTAINDNY